MQNERYYYVKYGHKKEQSQNPHLNLNYNQNMSMFTSFRSLPPISNESPRGFLNLDKNLYNRSINSSRNRNYKMRVRKPVDYMTHLKGSHGVTAVLNNYKEIE